MTHMPEIETFIIANLPLVMAIVAGTLILKGIALWRAARRGEKSWFVALLVVNTLGILEAIYILFVSKDKEKEF